jgi:hypothetical protein
MGKEFSAVYSVNSTVVTRLFTQINHKFCLYVRNLLYNLGHAVLEYWQASTADIYIKVLQNFTVKKEHARTFSSELIHIFLLKMPKVSNIVRNRS